MINRFGGHFPSLRFTVTLAAAPSAPPPMPPSFPRSQLGPYDCCAFRTWPTAAQWVCTAVAEALRFAGDPLLSRRDVSDSQALGNFANICPVIAARREHGIAASGFARAARGIILRSTAMSGEHADGLVGPVGDCVLGNQDSLNMLKPNNASSRAAPDRDLIRAAQAGDRAAYGELYRRYSPTVHGLILARVASDQAPMIFSRTFS